MTTKAQRKKAKHPALPDPIKPTPEWIARYGDHQITPTTETGLKMGRAYHREPWFESLVKRDWTDAEREGRVPAFAIDDLHALRRYRTAHEASLRSETRSSLNIERGGTGERGEQAPALIRARRELAMMETWLGPLADTVRAIAIDDMSYAQVAMARFGYREVEVYDDATGTFRTRTSPRSGRHPTLIREEFQQGVKHLAARGAIAKPVISPARPAASTGDISESVPTVGQTIDAALARAEASATPIVAIVMSPAVSDDIVRDLGSEGMVETWRGLPVTIRDDWRFGWVLVEG
ncbi:hypothetical protein [Sphingomonas sp. MMS24-J13]|uniref:hypothetical protein n=1 Tax=Sphingomonas sp. MMS24-J13 TaxID=3238686 RepID=UPI00384E9B57